MEKVAAFLDLVDIHARQAQAPGDHRTSHEGLLIVFELRVVHMQPGLVRWRHGGATSDNDSASAGACQFFGEGETDSPGTAGEQYHVRRRQRNIRWACLFPPRA